MGILTLIKDNVILDLSPTDPAWVQFVSDHLDYIASQSERFTIEAALINRYKYNLRLFLKENRQRNYDIAWIVLLVNQIPSDLYFSEVCTIYIPTDQFMKSLYQKYQTVSKNINT